MSHYTTKNIVIALLCSVTLHFMLAFAPNRTEHALINNNQGTSQLKLTLAKQAIVVPPASTLIESEEAKQQIDKISEPSEPSESTQNLVEPIISKSTSFNKTVSSPTLEKEETKIPPLKDAGVTETTEKRLPLPDEPSEPVAMDNSTEGTDRHTEIPAESMDSNLMKGWQSDLIQRINQQKRYPRQALRRGLEGDVKIKAMIHPDGTLATAEILSGDKRFKTSSLQAVSRALPFPPPVAVLKPITVSFIIHYTIN
ncbi:energy transducer TonB [Endozoicomonas elysicola]|uniref:TonB C-terminal domain-containing protein n=1 Tax=Endozoicomonas elysicola TaxID=305900 RepID=A0A081KG33_9GAMM|nr:energy transducer TonB [Endozoicomonas elysicola]KEI73109.1 hypothetical protein GV64_22485 [Endozoicomonas elysicola]